QKRRQTLTLVEFVNEQGQRFYTWQWRTLSELDIRSRHLLFQLVPSTPRIEGTEYGLLHTPRATMIEEPNENFIKRMGDRTDKCYPHLSAQVPDYVKLGLLATPTANPPADITPERAKELGWTWSGTSWIRQDGTKVQTTLNHQVVMLPTPQAFDGFKASIGTNQKSVTRTVKETFGKTSQLNHRFVLEMMGY